MLEKPSSCRGCPLDVIGEGFSVPTGSGALGVLVVAEALGRHEVMEGRPLVEWAEAGSIFQRGLDKAGFDRSQFALWNIIACRPPNNKFENMPWERGAAEHCRVHFDRVLEQFRPKVILAMGNTALKHLTGMTGKNRTVSSLRGYVLRCLPFPELLVVPTYHPSFIRRGASNLFRVFVEDIKRAVKVALGVDREFDLDPTPPPNFVLNPSERDVRDLLERIRSNPHNLLAYDIETDGSLRTDESELFKLDSEELTEDEEDASTLDAEKEKLDALIAKALGGPLVQIQFSLGVGHAICMPWSARFIPAIREALVSPNPKAGQNVWKFDNPLLRQAGMEINGIVSDTLWIHHHSQPDLPAHLQFIASFYGQRAPWKHMAGEDLAWYGCIDAEVIHRIMEKLPQEMDRIWLR